MKNIIHQFLDKKFSTMEFLSYCFIIIGIGGIVSKIFGREVQVTMGIIFLLVGLYGFARSYISEKSAKEKSK